MVERILDPETLNAFEAFFYAEERSAATVEKYLRDVMHFYKFVGSGEIENCDRAGQADRSVRRLAGNEKTVP